jgi:hypothetical protein
MLWLLWRHFRHRTSSGCAGSLVDIGGAGGDHSEERRVADGGASADSDEAAAGCATADGGVAADVSSGSSRGGDSGSAANGGESAGARSTGAGRLGISCGGVVGGEKHLSSCGIGHFLAKTAASY